MIHNRPLAALVAAFFVSGVSPFAAPRPATAAAPCPTVISHAAAAHLAPENTVAGIQAAAGAGAGWVEMDVRWSKGDGTAAYPGWPVLMHDASTKRTTGVDLPVDTTGLGDLAKLSAAAYAPWSTDARYAGSVAGKPKTPVPYAYDFLGALDTADASGLLDVKITPNRVRADKLMEYVGKFPGLADRLVYMGDAGNVQTMHGWYPSLRYAVIEYPPTGRVYTPAYLRSVGADVYAVPWTAVTPGLVAYEHAGGVRVYTWTSDRPEYDVPANWAALADAGVDALITNEPAAALATYRSTCSTASADPASPEAP